MIWVVLVSMVLLSAVFSGLEIAYVTSDKMQIEIINKRGGVISKIMSIFVAAPSRFITTLLIGNNLALVIYGVLMEKLLAPTLQETISSTAVVLLLQTLISTVIILVLAEYLPKTLFRIKPNHALRFFAIPMYGMYWLMKGFVLLAVKASKLFLSKFLKVDLVEDKPIFGRLELEEYIQERTEEVHHGTELDAEVQMYKNALDFASIRVKESMVPRTEIIALELNSDLEVLQKTFIETGLSKILIYKDSIEDIVGFVHSLEMFKSPKDIKSILLPVGFIPETMTAQVALNNFIQQRKSIMVVVDEFGGTAGMLTIEDVMEEIVGDIEDEHDTTDLIEQQLTDYEYLFSGRLEVDYLNQKFNLNIPEGESYETLGGFISTNTGSIPVEGETVIIDRFTFLIEKVSETRIELIKLFLQIH